MKKSARLELIFFSALLLLTPLISHAGLPIYNNRAAYQLSGMLSNTLVVTLIVIGASFFYRKAQVGVVFLLLITHTISRAFFASGGFGAHETPKISLLLATLTSMNILVNKEHSIVSRIVILIILAVFSAASYSHFYFLTGVS